jgi:shikimate kinase
MNVVLIGYRGTGKSSVGRILATRLGRDLMSTDAEIVRRANLSIPDIVSQYGWDYFRDLEATVCQDISSKDGQIIDTGGGAILRATNVSWLKVNGVLFWLTADVKTIVSRIGGDMGRPSLTGIKSFTEEIEEVLRERTPKYQAAADHIIATEGRTPTQVADQILSKIQFI